MPPLRPKEASVAGRVKARPPTCLLSAALYLAQALLSSSAGQWEARSQDAYILKYRPLADPLAAQYGIPVTLILGIAVLESSSGTSRNARLLNNHFGIVGKNRLLQTKGIRTRYKQYPDADSSFVDFCKLLSHRKYYAKLRGSADTDAWVDAMARAGYSERPDEWRTLAEKYVRSVRRYSEKH